MALPKPPAWALRAPNLSEADPRTRAGMEEALQELELPPSIQNKLKQNGIDQIRELAAKKRLEIQRLVGNESDMRIIDAKLWPYGYSVFWMPASTLLDFSIEELGLRKDVQRELASLGIRKQSDLTAIRWDQLLSKLKKKTVEKETNREVVGENGLFRIQEEMERKGWFLRWVKETMPAAPWIPPGLATRVEVVERSDLQARLDALRKDPAIRINQASVAGLKPAHWEAIEEAVQVFIRSRREQPYFLSLVPVESPPNTWNLVVQPFSDRKVRYFDSEDFPRRVEAMAEVWEFAAFRAVPISYAVPGGTVLFGNFDSFVDYVKNHNPSPAGIKVAFEPVRGFYLLQMLEEPEPLPEPGEAPLPRDPGLAGAEEAVKGLLQLPGISSGGIRELLHEKDLSLLASEA